MTDETTEIPETSPAPAEEIATTQPEVAGQMAMTIGDENMPAPRDVDVHIHSEPVAAMVMSEQRPAPAMVPVHEVYVTTDTVITDPSSPLAVQIPDAGRGTMDLPISGLNVGHVEDRFRAADEAAKS